VYSEVLLSPLQTGTADLIAWAPCKQQACCIARQRLSTDAVSQFIPLFAGHNDQVIAAMLTTQSLGYSSKSAGKALVPDVLQASRTGRSHVDQELQQWLLELQMT